MVDTVMSVLDSLGVGYAANATLNLEEEETPDLRDRAPSRSHLLLNDVEVEQCEHLDDIVVWRRTLMSSVLEEEE